MKSEKQFAEHWYGRARKQTPESLPAFLSELARQKVDYRTSAIAVGVAAALGNSVTSVVLVTRSRFGRRCRRR